MDHENAASADITAILEPGMFVRNTAAPDWGLGQVQSNIGGRITVNFRETGKMVIDANRVALLPVIEDR